MQKQLRSLARYLPLLIILLALAVRILPGARTIDDAYITYRYARNILAGDGFVYNPGERVLGTTTPLYTLLLVAVGSVTGGVEAPFPTIALILNALADAATALLLWRMGKRVGSPFAGAGTAILWAAAPFSVTFAIGGLETSLYVLLLTATVYAYIENKYTYTALFAALSLLTRPDALLLLGPLALDRLFRTFRRQSSSSRIPLNAIEVAAALVPTVAWFGFATFYFGSPIPHSVLAKGLAYRLPSTAAFIRLLQHYATPFLGEKTFGVPWIGVGLILYPFLSLIGIRSALREKRQMWPWAIYPWLYFATFAIANPLIFRWYLTPPLPAYFFFIFLGMEQLGRSLLEKLSGYTKPLAWLSQTWRRQIFWRILPALAILLPLLLTLRGWTLQPDHGPDRPAPEMAWFELELLYREAADQVTQRIEEQPSPGLPVLAAGDVGVLGFYTPTRILDTVGLNSPQTLNYYPLDESFYAINYAIPPDLIRDQEPDYLVILEVYGRKGLLKDAYFNEHYRLLHKIPTDIYGSDGMLIFEREAP